MELGDLKDSLLNLGKEKGKEAADNFLAEQEQQGGLLGSAIGFGKGLLDNALGGGETENAPSNESESPDGADESGSNDSEEVPAAEDTSSNDSSTDGEDTGVDASSDDSSNDGDDSDEGNQQ